MTLFTPRLNPVNCRPAGLVAMVVCVLIAVAGTAGIAFAQQSGGNGDSLEVQELKTAVAVLKKQLQAERGRNAGRLPVKESDDEQKKALVESLAEANRVAEQTRADYEELLLRMASLGVDLLKPDPKSLEQRLLKAVRERDLAEQEKEKLAGQLLRLSEASANFSRQAFVENEEYRRLLDEQVAGANRVLGLTTAAPVRENAVAISQGRVVSVDPEVGLIVLNVGRQSGVRTGMPLQLLREDRPIGTALVVDTRDTISGAVLQSLVAAGDDAKVGDRIKPQAQQL